MSTTDDSPDAAAFAVFSVVDVRDVVVDLPEQYPLLTLAEQDPPRRELAFPIGMAEGVALAYAQRRQDAPRPLTHELLTSVLRRLKADVVAARIVGRQAGALLAELQLMTVGGAEMVPCRASDAVIVALRQVVPAPILVDQRLFGDLGDVEPVSSP